MRRGDAGSADSSPPAAVRTTMEQISYGDSSKHHTHRSSLAANTLPAYQSRLDCYSTHVLALEGATHFTGVSMCHVLLHSHAQRAHCTSPDHTYTPQQILPHPPTTPTYVCMYVYWTHMEWEVREEDLCVCSRWDGGAQVSVNVHSVLHLPRSGEVEGRSPADHCLVRL